MTADTEPVRQVTASAIVTREDSGTGWLRLREGGRYFDVAIAGEWRGRVTLEVRPPLGDAGTGRRMASFDANIWKLFCLDRDAEVRLWVRPGEFGGGEMMLELGN